MNITHHAVVGLGYRLRDDAGQLLESRDAMTPLYYLHGEGMLLPAIEQALDGKQKGDRFELTLTPDQAYGERDPELVDQVPLEALGLTNPDETTPADQMVEPGMQLHGALEQTATVVKVNRDKVTIDANSPLAGKTLHVEGEVIDVRPAMPEEVSLGRASGQDDSSLLIVVTLRTQKDTE